MTYMTKCMRTPTKYNTMDKIGSATIGVTMKVCVNGHPVSIR